MAWDRLNKQIGSNGQVRCSPGYMSETITLSDSSDASTSNIPGPITTDFTVLVVFSDDLAADSYVKVEHSIDNLTWIKQGIFEATTGSIVNTDISKDMAKLAAIDISAVVEGNGLMMLYALDTHGKARYTRFTVSSGGDDSAETATFYLISHF